MGERVSNLASIGSKRNRLDLISVSYSPNRREEVFSETRLTSSPSARLLSLAGGPRPWCRGQAITSYSSVGGFSGYGKRCPLHNKPGLGSSDLSPCLTYCP
jgi:hypothetical protein